MNEKKWEQENVLRLVKKSRKGVLRVVFSRFGLMALLLILELVLLWMMWRWFNNDFEWFAAVERSRDAAVLSLLRGVILVVPCAVVLANIFGLTGLWLAVPTAEVLSLLCGLYLLYREKKSEKTALQAA